MAIDGQTMAEPGLAVPRVGPGYDMSQPSHLVRGACPSLARPMQTGDGLLVRLRPTTPRLSVIQFQKLAAATARHGNGLLEITARGNLQLRGLSRETMPGLEADIALAGIVPDTGLTIEVPPLSGRDPTEIADARVMAVRLREAVARLPRPLTLAPKLTIIVDGGGLLTLDALSADIRLMATPAKDAKPQWRVAVGGTRRSAVPVLLGSEEDAVGSVLDLLKSLDALGPQARGRDLVAGLAETPSPLVPASDEAEAGEPSLGLHRLTPKTVVLGLRPAFGQIHAGDLMGFLAIADALGIDEIRTAPDHSVLLFGAPGAMVELQSVAPTYGLWTSADTPASHIATCSGAGACASATYRTKHLAKAVIDWIPELLDGSIVLHLSGCPKGCAHPGGSAIAVVGLPTGFGIVVDGKTSGRPAVIVDETGLQAALRRVALLVADTKEAGESVGDCLTRLGSNAIIAALRQE